MPIYHNVETAQWQRYLASLRRFIEANGHSRVPVLYVDDGVEPPVHLGYWVSYVRGRFRSGLLSDEKKASIDALGPFIWGLMQPGPRRDLARDRKIKKMYADGKSLRVIGNHYGLSRQRIHQIIHS